MDTLSRGSTPGSGGCSTAGFSCCYASNAQLVRLDMLSTTKLALRVSQHNQQAQNRTFRPGVDSALAASKCSLRKSSSGSYTRRTGGGGGGGSCRGSACSIAHASEHVQHGHGWAACMRPLVSPLSRYLPAPGHVCTPHEGLDAAGDAETTADCQSLLSAAGHGLGACPAEVAGLPGACRGWTACCRHAL